MTLRIETLDLPLNYEFKNKVLGKDIPRLVKPRPFLML